MIRGNCAAIQHGQCVALVNAGMKWRWLALIISAAHLGSGAVHECALSQWVQLPHVLDILGLLPFGRGEAFGAPDALTSDAADP